MSEESKPAIVGPHNLPRLPNGKPKGQGHRLTANNILLDIKATLGRTYSQQLAINYQAALDSGDRQLIQRYDQALIAKLVSDKLEVSVNDSPEVVAERQSAFLAQLARMREAAANIVDTTDAVDVTPKQQSLDNSTK